MIGVASLSLAACGGGAGDSTVTAPAPATQTPPDETPDCTAVPRPAGCPDPEPRKPVVPLPLDGLGGGPKTAAAVALREVADATKVQLTAPKQPRHPNYSQSVLPYDKLSIQGVQFRTGANSPSALGRNFGNDTKLPKIVPSGSAGNITYSFGLYTPKVVAGEAIVDTFLGQIRNQPFEHKIFALENNAAFTSVKQIESIAKQLGKGWDYSILHAASVPSVKDGAKDSKLYAELWTDYASAGENDYMVGGWWLLVPDNPAGDYRFGALARGENLYARWNPITGQVKPAVTGEATYKGPAAGLFVSSENSMVSIQRLLGKVTLTADFGNASDRGTIGGRIDDLTRDGDSVRGQILLPKATLTNSMNSLRFPLSTASDLNKKSNIGNIEGINYQGDWVGTTLGDSSGTDQPTGIVGVVGGSGGGNSFVASFGAKKVEDE